MDIQFHEHEDAFVGIGAEACYICDGRKVNIYLKCHGIIV